MEESFLYDLNKRPFIEISIDGVKIGKILFRLYDDECPRTCRNFRTLCNGSKLLNGKALSYKGSSFFRGVKNLMIQGGDFNKNNGLGGASIYGMVFADENLKLKHEKKGMLSMANSGPDTNNSQFFITFDSAPCFDGKNVAFGEVDEGMDVLEEMHNVCSLTGKLKKKILIDNCGEE